MDFHKVDAPVFYPSACHVCSGQTGPQVDTLVENLNGRIYLCHRCVKTAALKLGWTEPAAVQEMLDVVMRASDQVTQLEDELARERENKVVSLADVKALLDQVPERPKPKGKAA